MDLPNQTGKRVRDDSQPNSPVSKIARVDSLTDVVGSPSPPYQLARSDSDSSGPTHIQNDLLNILDDTDNLPERMHGLDSVIKSFEEEILAPDPDPKPEPEPEPGDFHVELGFLLEASDDELGLPPTRPESEDLGRAGSEGVDMGELVGFGGETEKYGQEGLGGGENEKGGEILGFEGLLDLTESYDVVWRSESLQAM